MSYIFSASSDSSASSFPSLFPYHSGDRGSARPELTRSWEGASGPRRATPRLAPGQCRGSAVRQTEPPSPPQALQGMSLLRPRHFCLRFGPGHSATRPGVPPPASATNGPWGRTLGPGEYSCTLRDCWWSRALANSWRPPYSPQGACGPQPALVHSCPQEAK